MNVLIIEDDKLTLTSLQFGLTQLGHTVYTAEGVEEAINVIVDNKIDVLLSDVMMSRISGLSLVAVLRSVYSYTIPIIMMSSLNNSSLQEEIFKAGADDFIPKPFTLNDLSQKLDKYNPRA
jgi:DNA-binding response OmpR family regulator